MRIAQKKSIYSVRRKYNAAFHQNQSIDAVLKKDWYNKRESNIFWR